MEVQKRNCLHIVISSINRANWYKINDTKYCKGAVVHIGYDGVLPKFSLVEKNCYLSSRPLEENNIVFLLKEIITLNYDSHIYAFRIGHISPIIGSTIKQSCLITFRPLHIHKPIQMEGINGICPKLDVDMYM